MISNEMILASAGSGKTYQLSNRIAGLVLRGVEPRRIAALTFTRKAAGEFADAVVEKLAIGAKDQAVARRLGAEMEVAANQAASATHYPPFSWPGGSMIVDYDGRILAQADPGPVEKIVVAPIDLAALRHERQRRRGHAMQAHLRTEAYTAYAHPIYPAGAADNGSVTVELNNHSTQDAREALERIALKRLITVEQVAHAVNFFAAYESGALTGQTLCSAGP